MKYPGDCATPKETAAWMASVAEEEFGLPGILPVMTSCVELTAAWVSEGCVDDIPGYLSAVDHNSVGWFQQQPPWWGTVDEILDPEYSLRAFCRQALKYKRQFPDTPEGLGEWCATVQNPRLDLRGLYATKGYPMAKELLATSDVTDWPQIKVAFDSQGWAYDPTSQNWLRSDRDVKRDADGWLFGQPDQPPSSVWKWPVANEAPAASGTYSEMYPTRYNWRSDVEAWARYLVDNYDVWCNTYYRHPPPWDRETTSLDVWGPAGRGDPIEPVLGEEIFNLLFDDPGKPDIEWCIWQAWIWTRSGGWQPYGTDDFSWHYDHCHFTYE